MYGQMLISFREGFEAALLVAIVVSYLKRTGRSSLVFYLILGSIVGIVGSMVTGAIAYYTYAIVEEKELVEALGAFVAVPVLTSVIYWMATKSRHIRREVEKKVETAVSKRGTIGIALLGVIFVYREGFETVLFTLPLMFQQPIGSIVGVTVGVLGSILLSYAIVRLGFKMDMKKFFYYTSVLLILVASGILGYGVHELIEYGEDREWAVEPWSTYVYRIPLDPSNQLHEKGVLGSIFAVLFGYTTKMELGRLIAQLLYLIAGLTLVFKAYRREAS